MVEAIKRHELYRELGSIVGAKYVSDDYSVLLSYTRDVSTFPPGKPQGVIARPGSVDEVVEIVRLANQTRIPIIPMGGKASISGVPPGQPGRGIIVDMRRMSKVLDIDKENMAVTAQGGITMGELAGKVNEHGYDIHTAGVPHYINTIGGHISGIPGGGFGGYGFCVGFNWHYILGMKVVLPNGKVVDTGTGEGSLSTYRGHAWARSMQGPDIGGMFIGDGGIFGIKVEATVRMFHLPKFQKGGARCFDTLDQAFAAYHELWETDTFLYMQHFANGMILCPEVMEALDPMSKPAWVVYFINIANSQEEVDLKCKITDEVCVKHGGTEASASLLDLTSRFISMVQNTGQMATQGQFPLFELYLARRDALEAYKWSREWIFSNLAKRGIDKSNIPILGGILAAGTGNGMLTIIPMINQNDKELLGIIHELLEEWLELAMRRGYVPEGTQGHESRLKSRQWTPEYYDYILTLKKTLDPNNIMNPGIFFP